MQYYRIVSQPVTLPTRPVEPYDVWALSGDLEQRLNREKIRSEALHKNKAFQHLLPMFHPFHVERRKIELASRGQHVTNAWLKMTELLAYFRLVSKGTKALVHFDNAAFPGAFIMATNHWTKTRGIEYRWHASSMISTDVPLLNDTFGLLCRHPDNWLMSASGNDGDVMSPSNIDDWEKRLEHRVSLYTSDLGFETGRDGDYSRQEKDHLCAHLGQILAGLVTLRNRGHLVCKQYTFFSIFNVTLYACLTQLFTEVWISKPATSRSTNSETYLVCRGFLGPFAPGTKQWAIVQHLRARLADFNDSPLLDRPSLTNDFMISVQAAYQIHERQIKRLVKRRKWCAWLSNVPEYRLRKTAIESIQQQSQGMLDRWRQLIDIKRLGEEHKL